MENIFYLLLGAFLILAGIWVKWYISRQEKFDKYKLATVEKRLETHQIAYSLTFEIQKAASPEKFDGVFNKMHKWWTENNFYLEPKSRKAFRDCYWELLIFQKKTTNPEIVERRMRFSKSLLSETRRILTEDIGLPWLGEEQPDFSKKQIKKSRRS